MRITQIFLIAVMPIGHNLCFGQNNEPKKELVKVQFNTIKDSIFFVLKVDDQSLEFDPKKNEDLDLVAIDPNSIETISVLKGNDAKNKYGDKGQSGVVIITFKEFNLTSKELQKKFSNSNKK